MNGLLLVVNILHGFRDAVSLNRNLACFVDGSVMSAKHPFVILFFLVVLIIDCLENDEIVIVLQSRMVVWAVKTF